MWGLETIQELNEIACAIAKEGRSIREAHEDCGIKIHNTTKNKGD